ncbi:MAG: type II secretion system protein [Campylobacterota bacterium]|nr:type II secretion system protein [Campylobacterota bacterium]
MRAFTLIELIFVIVIIGILTSIGVTSFKPKYLNDDLNFIQSKIKEAQFLGIGFEHLNFDGSVIDNYDASGCIRIEKSALEESMTTNKVNYQLHVDINPADTTICFDSKGRPREDDFNGTLLTTQKTFQISYKNEEKNITIEPITGYVIINF